MAKVGPEACSVQARGLERRFDAPKSNTGFRLAYPELARGILAREDELVQRVLDSDVSGF
jgi:hypothetical protein